MHRCGAHSSTSYSRMFIIKNTGKLCNDRTIKISGFYGGCRYRVNENPKLEAKLKHKNQSVENACVAFVKGANERNELFEKKKQTGMYDEQGKGLTISGTN